MTRLLIIITLSLGMVACASDATTETTANISTAADRGRNDAATLLASEFSTERELHSALLSVKSREWKLRQQGDTIGATAYINAFRSHIAENDAELAAKIF